jgi:outer membrane PBP1 activator LpoA protein
MPWMLKTPQYSWLQQQTQELWPGRRDTQNRLFALGYDAFNLAPSLEFLDLLPNQSWRGMTGELILDEKNQINRKSTLAQFNEQEVLPVASD